MQVDQKGPTSGSYWVRPRLLAGEYPGASNYIKTLFRLRRLLHAGMTYFLDLTEEWEKGLEPYASLLQELAGALEMSVEYRRIALPDFEAPTVPQMVSVLDEIDTALARTRVVYVHCYAGIGRTGMAVGCYLVRHGLGGEGALAELERLRQGTRFGKMSSPVTPGQKQLVLDWAMLDAKATRPGRSLIEAFRKL